jgi:hypothetical protein
MDEIEMNYMNYIFNELDTILELIEANFIVRNVQRHILISTAVKTLTLENAYELFFIRSEK